MQILIDVLNAWWHKLWRPYLIHNSSLASSDGLSPLFSGLFRMYLTYPSCSSVSFSFVMAGDLAKMYLLISILSSTGKFQRFYDLPCALAAKDVWKGWHWLNGHPWIVIPQQFAVNGVPVFESKLTESITEVLNATPAKQWHWQHCLLGLCRMDCWQTITIVPRKPRCHRSQSCQRDHWTCMVSHSWSISSSFDASLLFKSAICCLNLTVPLDQLVSQGRHGHVTLHANYGSGDNVFTPCPVWYNVTKQ